MKTIKVLIVFGTRPEAIKLAPIILKMRTDERFTPIICVTAQHRNLLDQVMETFEIHSDFDLNIMQNQQTLVQSLTKSLLGLDDIVNQTQPDLVLVQGDTNTTLAGSLAAYYHKVKIGHVEAGLRTYDKYSPFPEEMNRQIVSLLADMHFAPTEQSKTNLINEGKSNNDIFITGNTAIDALKYTLKKDYHHPLFDWLGEDRLILLTAHRRENIGIPLKNIYTAIHNILQNFNDVKVIYPVHPNPSIMEIFQDSLLKDDNRIRIIPPMEVHDFHNFINRSYLILTDSGGIQEEAPSLGKPVLVLRKTTERPEGVDAGTLKLVGTDPDQIFSECEKLLTDKEYYSQVSRLKNPYGDGNSSARILDIIYSRLG